MGPWFAPAPVGPPVPFHSQQTFPCMGKILLLSHYLPQTLFLHAHEWRLLHPYGNQLLVSKPLASRPPTATACDRCGACPLLSRIWAALLFKPNLTLQPNLQNPTKLRIIHFRDMIGSSLGKTGDCLIARNQKPWYWCVEKQQKIIQDF